jgi:hypothetical protein
MVAPTSDMRPLDCPFHQPLIPASTYITSGTIERAIKGENLPAKIEALSIVLSDRYHFFHWPIEFPEVFRAGGFDVLVGNPPWDKIQPEEQKFFASIRPDIAAASAKQRKLMIEALPGRDPGAYRLWKQHKYDIALTSRFLSGGGQLLFSGEGNLNTYRVFTEVSSRLIATKGCAGLVVQSGLATDESGKELFADLMLTDRLISFFDFENRKKFFPAVDTRFRFSLVTIGGSHRSGGKATFGWLLHELESLADPARLVRLSPDDILLFNPHSKTCPIFTSVAEFCLSRHIYMNSIHLAYNKAPELSKLDFLGELFNQTRDVKHFEARASFNGLLHLPLYEAKYIHQFDHRFATIQNGQIVDADVSQKQDPNFSAQTLHMVETNEVLRRLQRRTTTRGWLCGFRSVSRATDERTAIMAILPEAAISNSINLVLNLNGRLAAFLASNVNSFVFDFCCRQKVSGMNLNIWIFKQLPIIPPGRYSKPAYTIGVDRSFGNWILPRVMELVYTSNDLRRFAEDCGFQGNPFEWNEERRCLIRAELDAAYFHYYLPSDEDGRWLRLENETAEQFSSFSQHFS